MSLAVSDWGESDVRAFGGRPSAATIGVFDGVHRGHAELIRRVAERGPNPTVITFRENPKKILAPESYTGDIFSLEQKLEIFDGFGVRQVMLIDFSLDFSKIKGLEFAALLEKRLDLVFLAVGSNFRCGYRQDTDAEFIRRINEGRGIPTEIVPPVLEDGLPVSSSRVRAAVAKGDVAAAAVLLGRNLELDLRGISPRQERRGEAEGCFFNARLLHRGIPAGGCYAALVKTADGGFRADVIVNREGVFIPFGAGFGPGNAKGVEFLPPLKGVAEDLARPRPERGGRLSPS